MVLVLLRLGAKGPPPRYCVGPTTRGFRKAAGTNGMGRNFVEKTTMRRGKTVSNELKWRITLAADLVVTWHRRLSVPTVAVRDHHGVVLLVDLADG